MDTLDYSLAFRLVRSFEVVFFRSHCFASSQHLQGARGLLCTSKSDRLCPCIFQGCLSCGALQCSLERREKGREKSRVETSREESREESRVEKHWVEKRRET